jgi:putative oxidoreductase
MFRTLVREQRFLPPARAVAMRRESEARSESSASKMGIHAGHRPSATRSDAALLVIRAVSGGLLAGHGAQKLFGTFDGPGLGNTAQVMERIGLKPGSFWGTLAAVSEFGGGGLLALGLLSPLAAIGAASAMTMAVAKGHWGKPIWASQGGGELAVAYGALALGVGLGGPGKYSLDHALGIKVPAWVVAGAGLGALALLGLGIQRKPAPAGEQTNHADRVREPAAATDAARNR